MNLLIQLTIAFLGGSGIWLCLSRDWLRTVLGVSLISHAINILLLASSSGNSSDYVPQALVLTAIVIGFGFTAFLILISRLTAERSKSLDTDDLFEKEDS